jgi:pimeloyl-ACP methyl ester carboxylesterase
MGDLIKLGLLLITKVYQAIATYREERQPPPGKLVDVGGYRLHYYLSGEAPLTIVIDHSLGGLEGYFLVEELKKLARVWVYERAGYGWSDSSPYPRHSEQIVQELDTLLSKAGVNPPYLLVGDSFGSYSMRLYAHLFPEKVAGMVLTDGLHETEMLQMPLGLRLVNYPN